ncbi:hypothetical protein [Nocardia sp. A7]|uniref:hypothetical protein n=1 Tax=Nocardia sp. A7 TaxID=2789274 RepID=UPI00397AAC27
MATIGYATLVIIPTARGISSQVSRQIVAPVAKAGRTAGDQAGTGISTGINRTNYSQAGQGMVGPVARAGRRAGIQAGHAIQQGIDDRDYEASGRDAGGRFVSGFSTGLRGLGAAFSVGTAGLRLFVVNAGTIATGFGIAAKIVKSFSAATFISAVLLKQVAATGLAKLAGALRIIAAIASRVAKEIGQITSAFLVLQGVVKLVGAMTGFAKNLAKMTVGAAAAIGVVSGLATIVGGALSAALSAGVMALGAFAGAAAGLGGPAIFALKIGMKGLADGAKDFNKQFSDADETFNKMVGQRMGPMLTAFRTMRMEMVDRFSKELEPAFARVGVGIDQVRGKFGWMSVYLGQLGQDIGMSLTGPATIEAFQKMGDASGVFFQHLNKAESGLGGLSSGLVTFASTAATTFQDSSAGLNEMFLGFGEKLRSITPEQIRGALSQFKQVFENIGNVAGPLLNLFVQMGRISAQALAPGFVAIGNGIREATPALLNMASIIMPALGRVMQELAPLIPRLVEAFTPWATMLATIAPPLASLVANLAPLAPYLLLIATGFKIAGAVMLLWNAAAFAGAVASGVLAAAMGRTLPVTHGSTVAFVANRIAMLAGSVAAHAFGSAMTFALSPIGLIIIAVAAIGVALWAFFTKTEVGKALWDKIWNGIKTAVSATWAFLKPIFSAIGSWFTQTLVPAVMGFWHGAIAPAFSAIGSLISSWWTGIVQPAFAGLKIAIGVVGDVIGWWWNNIVSPAFSAAGTAISYFWETVGSPIFNNFKKLIGLVGDAIMWWWNDVATPAFQAIGAVISWLWDSVGSPVFENMKTGVSVLGEAFTWFKDNVITPVFDTIGAAISFAWDNVMSPIFDKVKSGIGLVGDAFGAAGGVIKSMWSGVADTLRPAVHFLGGLLVKVPSSIGGFEIPGAGAAQDLGRAMQNFRTGGTVGPAGRTSAGVLWGPGTGTSDSILGVDTKGFPTALVSTGEGVVTEAGMDAGGNRLVAALNAGWTPSAATLAAMFPELNGYATGGKVSRSQFLDQLRGIEGATYDFGGWGNGWVTDCSGAQAKAANLIAYGDTETGGRFGTGTMAKALADRGALPGLGGPNDYNLGWYNGGPYGGHTAGSAPGGTGFEMGGARGNGQFGGGAALATGSKFTDHAHFPARMFTDTAAGTSAATSPPSTTTGPSSTDTGDSSDATTSSTATSVSRLKTFDELGADFASIFRAGLLETVGLDGELWTDPSAWLKGDTGDSVRTTDNTSATTGATPSSPAAETVAPSSSTGTGTGDANSAVPVDPASSLKGSALYSYDIAKVARDMGMGEIGAVIGNAVGLVETELKMYANSTVPESLSYAHDAVGSADDSLGVMQQRGPWGSVADRMTSQISARLFMKALGDIPGWESMDPGAAAQAVQRSAFPHKYAGRMDEASDWVRKAGLFDTGGMLMPGGVAVSMLSKPEPLLPADKWDTAAANIDAVDRLLSSMATTGGGRGNVQRGGDTYIAHGYTAGEIASEWSRRQWARTGGYDGRGW